jgi:hypothetical protein
MVKVKDWLYSILHIINTWYSSFFTQLLHQTDTDPVGLPSVGAPLEVEPQLKNVVVELTLKASLVGAVPLSIHDLKSDIFIWRTCMET